MSRFDLDGNLLETPESIEQRERRKESYKKRHEYTKQWQGRNKERIKLADRKHHLKSEYNLTLEEYDTMLIEQDGRCAIPTCRVEEPGGSQKRFHVDHDHATGKIRRLLCHRCNATVSNHSAEHLRALADYVEFWALRHYNTEE